MPLMLSHSFWLSVASLTFIFAFVIGLDLLRGIRQVRALRDVPAQSGAWPLVSIVIAARNEEKTIEAALQSVLRLDYPRREILIMEDRSTDGTAAVLARLGSQHPELRVVRIESLSEGWIGKNHALYLGARQARGEILLLSDADIVMEPSTLRRAIVYLRANRVDHLALFPEVRTSSWLLDLCVGSFSILFNTFMRPWKAKDPTSRYFIGVGAFNLIRREVYEAVGGHQSVRMRPDEDVKLGKLVKQAGFRQDLVCGASLVSVEWYSSTAAFVRGLEKNMFAGINYQLWAVVLSSLLLVVLGLFPPLGCVLGRGAVRWIDGAIILLYCLIYYDNARLVGVNRWLGFLFPVGTVIFLGTFWNATWQTLRRGGIYWRGTFYPLEQLKANQV